jgi:putative nucleotidyltransferase with HDIG domain
MFLVKESGRAPWERQVRDLLLGMVAEQQPELHQHSGEVAEHVRAVGRRLGLAHVELQQAVWAAELHDVGKCAIPREILDKPGPLDLSEWAIMRTHTVVGERMLARAPAMAGVAALVRSSHERWDGRGYPDELAAEAIPLGARVIAACDAYDAMRSDRPYQRARSHEDAIAELRRGAGSQFDPAVVDALEATLSPGFQAALAPAEPRRRPGSAQRADVTT